MTRLAIVYYSAQGTVHAMARHLAATAESVEIGADADVADCLTYSAG